MSTTVSHMSTYQSQIPASQSAPVLKFRCQFTHDLTRKKKRWQDGFCDFHTYNKKAMVYDKERITVGGMHWKESDEIQQDDEFTLENEGLLVRVDEAMGQAVADLRPLIEHRAKTHEGRTPRLPASSRMGIRSEAPTPATPGSTNDRHRSIASLLPGLRNPIGRAALPESPYEQRQREQENEQDDGRSPKRRRLEPFSITKTTTPRLNKPVTPLMARTAANNAGKKTSAKAQAKRTASQKQLPVRECIDLLSDSPTNNGEDYTPLTQAEQRSSSPQVRMSPPPPPVFVSRPSVRERLPALQAPAPRPSERPRAAVRAPPPEPAQIRTLDISSREQDPRSSNALRIVKSTPRPKLLCQPTAKKTRTEEQVQDPKPRGVRTISRRDTSRAARNVQERAQAANTSDKIPVHDNDFTETIQSSIPEVAVVERPKANAEHWSKTTTERRRQTDKIPHRSRSRSSSPAFCTLMRGKPGPQDDAMPKKTQAITKKIAGRVAPLIEKRLPSSDLPSDLGDYLESQTELTSMRPPRLPLKLAAPIELDMVSSGPDPPTKVSVTRPKPTIPTRRSGSIRRVVSAADAELALVATDAFDSSHIDDGDELPDPPNRTSVKPSDPPALARLKRPAIKRSTSDVTNVQSSRKAPNVANKSKNLNLAPLIPPKPSKPKHIGPWTIEATDLFDWRPPDWDERLKKLLET